MHHRVRAGLTEAILMASQPAESPRLRAFGVRTLACFAGVCCCLFPCPADAQELEGPLVAYTTVSISIPDPLPSLNVPTLPGSLPDSSSGTSQEGSLAASLTRVPEDAPVFLNPPDLGIEASMENLSLLDERQLDNFLKTSARGSRFGTDEFVLLRKKMPSRYAYDSWADLNTGFGRFFPDEAIARCRTSGVGVEDPDWIYVKMTFRF